MAEPTFLGVDHAALTVTDPARSTHFYVEVLDFTVVLEGDAGVLFLHQDTGFTLALLRPEGASGETFSHLRTGLDHLGLAVRDREELAAWAERLERRGVAFTPVVDERLGHHLSFRDPDGIALELFAPNALYAGVRAELLSRRFSDEEVQVRAAELLGLVPDEPRT